MPPQTPPNDRNSVIEFVTDSLIEGVGTVIEIAIEIGGGAVELIAGLLASVLDGLG